jgi:cytochrome P450
MAVSVANSPKNPVVQMPAHSLLGNMRELNRDTLQFMLDAYRYGDFVRFWFGPFPAYIVNHPDLIQQVMVTDAQHYYKTRNLKQIMYPAIGEGLLTNDGDSWKRQRKLAQPAFHTKRIASYADVMVDYTHRMMDTWHDQETLDVLKSMSHLTMQIISKTVFDAQVSGEDELSRAVSTILKTVDKRFSRLLSLPRWVPTPENRRINHAVARIDAIIQQFIDDRRRTGEDKGDLLSMLMAAQDEDNGTGMSDKQLRDEAMTVFGAGHETTSLNLTWTLYALSQYPEVEAKLHAEIDRVLGDRPATFEDLPNLPYTEWVIKESMRLYPPVWGTSRQTIDTVDIGGNTLAKNNVVLVNIYAVHRDERYFPQPHLFQPERFAPENEKNIPRYAYLPFGAGPRVCIGNSFAMMEARLVLASLVQRFRFRLADGQKVQPVRQFTLHPKYGMKMVAQARRV